MHVRRIVGMAGLAILGTAFAPVPLPRDPNKTAAGIERKILEGNWVVKYLEAPTSRSRNRVNFQVGTRISIQGDKWRFVTVTRSRSSRSREGRFDEDRLDRDRRGRGKRSRGDYFLEVDPRQKPLALKLKRGSSEIALQAVYQLEGNVLRLCFAAGSDKQPQPRVVLPRPKSASLVILERIQP